MITLTAKLAVLNRGLEMAWRDPAVGDWKAGSLAVVAPERPDTVRVWRELR